MLHGIYNRSRKKTITVMKRKIIVKGNTLSNFDLLAELSRYKLSQRLAPSWKATSLFEVLVWVLFSVEWCHQVINLI